MKYRLQLCESADFFFFGSEFFLGKLDFSADAFFSSFSIAAGILRGVIRVLSNIYDGTFCKNNKRPKSVNYFLICLPS